MDDDDYLPETPPLVVGAIAAGVTPLPFLLVYAVLFIAHGTISPVVPPDITNSKGDELVAGLIALAAFCLMSLSLLWLMNRRRRWPFVIGQLAAFAACVDFVVDPTVGAREISVVVALTSAAAVVLALMPISAQYVGSRWSLDRLRAPGAGAKRYAGRRRIDTSA